MRSTALDRQWDELMSLCRKEEEFKRDNRHPKLVLFLSEQIDKLAKELGFGDRQIQHREFRAEKDGEHIVRLFTE